MARIQKIKKFVRIISLVSIVVMILLRLYALFFTEHIVTWDDKRHRELAIESALNLSIWQALGQFFLPCTKAADFYQPSEHSYGYRAILVISLKLLGSSNPELAFHLTNFLLFIAQIILVYLFSSLASENKIFSSFFTALYSLQPIVFGINRWIMTENIVLFDHLLISLISFWLLKSILKTKNAQHGDLIYEFKNNFIYPGLAAYLIGIASTIREYAIASVIIIIFCTICGLTIEKRGLALIIFIAVISPFLWALSIWSLHPVKDLLDEFHKNIYNHPLEVWIAHSFIYSIGPAMTLLLGYLCILILETLYSSLVKFLSLKGVKEKIIYLNKNLTSKHILLIAYLFLFALYATVIFLSSNKGSRPAIILMLCAVGIVLLGTSLFKNIKSLIDSENFLIKSCILIFVSWIIMIYQLFIAYNGGKSFAHHAFKLEKYNHPLFIRKLNNSNDMHITY